MARQPGEAILLALDEVSHGRREGDRQHAVGDHGHGHVDGQQGGIVEGRDERLDGGRQRGRVADQEERHAERQEGQRSDGVAVLQQQVAGQGAHGEGDGELVHVAPRTAAHDDGASCEAASQQQEAGPGEAVADGRQRGGTRSFQAASGPGRGRRRRRLREARWAGGEPCHSVVAQSPGAWSGRWRPRRRRAAAARR